ncbi:MULTISPECIES: hypothetical protein [Frankia]|uniref:hypothetical protein n=1 Tax=Frankia sp. B2 TaxID=2541730 RepID=UPI000053B681|nr:MULTISPECIES: hypothetical protein [Frankia]
MGVRGEDAVGGGVKFPGGDELCGEVQPCGFGGASFGEAGEVRRPHPGKRQVCGQRGLSHSSFGFDEQIATAALPYTPVDEGVDLADEVGASPESGDRMYVFGSPVVDLLG